MEVECVQNCHLCFGKVVHEPDMELGHDFCPDLNLPDDSI